MTVHEASSAGPEASSGPGKEHGQEGDATADVDAATALDERTAEMEDRLRRVLADLDNLRKRFEREVTRERNDERARTTAAWLPVVDDLERALDNAGDETDPVVEGVRAVHEHAMTLLERLGFPRFDDVGAPFDPVRHEAVSAVDADAPPGTIVGTVRPGYGRDEHILRPAAVVVSKR